MIKTAMSIAGSDCSGGAGIQADIKTMSALGVFGMSVIVSVVAENTSRVVSISDVPPQIIADQIDAVFEDIRVEDCEEARLIDVRVLYNPKYNREPGGTVHGVTFRNITYQGEGGDMYPMRMMGYDEHLDVRDITLENIVVNGQKMVDLSGVEVNEYVRNVQVK